MAVDDEADEVSGRDFSERVLREWYSTIGWMGSNGMNACKALQVLLSFLHAYDGRNGVPWS